MIGMNTETRTSFKHTFARHLKGKITRHHLRRSFRVELRPSSKFFFCSRISHAAHSSRGDIEVGLLRCRNIWPLAYMQLYIYLFIQLISDDSLICYYVTPRWSVGWCQDNDVSQCRSLSQQNMSYGERGCPKGCTLKKLVVWLVETLFCLRCKAKQTVQSANCFANGTLRTTLQPARALVEFITANNGLTQNRSPSEFFLSQHVTLSHETATKPSSRLHISPQPSCVLQYIFKSISCNMFRHAKATARCCTYCSHNSIEVRIGFKIFLQT